MRKIIVAAVLILLLGSTLFAATNTSGDTWSVALKGFVQSVGYLGVRDVGAFNDQFVLRRARLDARVKRGDYLEGRLQGDLASLRLMDAYVVIKPFETFRLTLGQFKHPLSRERAQSVPSLFFHDFSYTAQVAPNRDLGLQLSGSFLSGALAFHAAILNGSKDGGCPSPDISDDKEIAGRLDLTPAPLRLKGLSLGLGASYSLTAGETLGTVSTPGRTKVFAYDSESVSEGVVLRLAPHLCYYGKRFAAIGEYITSRHRVINGDNAADLVNNAASLSLSWVLCGGTRNAKGFTTHASFDPSNGSWGGLDLVGRVQGFWADPDAFPLYASSESAVSSVVTAEGGLNWYVADNTCFMLTYSKSSFLGGAADGDRAPERLLTLTANLAF